jgi:hypothetical protein
MLISNSRIFFGYFIENLMKYDKAVLEREEMQNVATTILQQHLDPGSNAHNYVQAFLTSGHPDLVLSTLGERYQSQTFANGLSLASKQVKLFTGTAPISAQAIESQFTASNVEMDLILGLNKLTPLDVTPQQEVQILRSQLRAQQAKV